MKDKNIIDNQEDLILNKKSKVKLICPLCDKCCEYRGDIKITPINVLQISKFLKTDIENFMDLYTEDLENTPEIVIKGIGEKRVCIFNNRENNKCMVQKVKPVQCVVFPLIPVDINNDLFVNSNQCKIKSKKEITVDKWLNGNHNIYDKNKKVYLKWIELIDEINPKWKYFSREKKDRIKSILYKEYNTKKDYEKQVLDNIQKARREYLLN